MTDELDRRFLAAAIRLGAGALGTTWPNPAVGAIVVKDGMVVGRGRTAPGGRPHGERWRLPRQARRRAARRSTSRSSPARITADAALRRRHHRGRGRAGRGARWPIPIRAWPGRGFARLRAAGIEVVTGVLADEARARACGAHQPRRRAGGRM